MIEPATVRGIGIFNVAAIERRGGTTVGGTRSFGAVRSLGTAAHRIRAPPG